MASGIATCHQYLLYAPSRHSHSPLANLQSPLFTFTYYIYVMILSSPHLEAPPRRIVSLVPSQTELLYHLGLEEQTIAITRFCIHPDHWFHGKTRIGGTKAIDIEKIISLKPDLIIANKEENVKGQVEMLAAHFPVWLTDVNTLNDALMMISDIGLLTHTTAQASQLIKKIEEAFKDLPQRDPVPAAYLIWKDPYMTIGRDTFIHDMMQKAGLENVFGKMSRYPEVDVNKIKASGCRLLLLSTEPYPFSLKHVTELSAQLSDTTIRIVDGEMFSWYGSRLLKAADYFKTFLPEPITP